MIQHELKDVKLTLSEIETKQQDQFKVIIEDQLESLNEKIKDSIFAMQERVTGIEDNTELLVKSVNSEIKNYVKGFIEEQTKKEIEKSLSIASELKEIKKIFADSKNDHQNLLNSIIEKQSENLNEKIENSFESIENSISKIEDKTESAVEGFNNNFKSYIKGIVEKQSKNEELQKKVTKTEFKDLKELLFNNENKKDKLFKSIIENQFQDLSEKVKESKADFSDNAKKQLEENVELSKMLKTDFTDITKSFKDSEKKQHDLLNSIFYSIKKQLSNSNREKEELEKFKNWFFTNLADIKNNIAGFEEKFTENIYNNFIVEIKNSMEKLFDKFNNLKENKDAVISLVDKKTNEHLNNFRSGIVNEFTNTFEEFLKEENSLKDLIKEKLNVLPEILRQIEELGNVKDNDQSSVLNSIYYSVKKVINIYDKEKDTSKKTDIQLLNALDVLYGHIRRLESEKDDRGLELLRLGGDKFQKEKLTTIENELKTQEKLAKRYLQEKNELEEKLKKLEEMWEKLG